MAFDAWHGMLADKRYRSVLFLKNHGPLSGGSLRHPHMQLIGLYDIDYHPNIRRDYFSGPVIHQAGGAVLNISDHPRIGFTEFNVILQDEGAFVDFCLLLQKAVKYLLQRHHNGQIASYNLFFYTIDGVTCCKVMPRYATTPVYMGYAIPQVIDDLGSIVEEVRSFCFP
jgi:ATP adenylyltransferase/5',5'''-P-1,P-4-tetraphosphate phosphorylase II